MIARFLLLIAAPFIFAGCAVKTTPVMLTLAKPAVDDARQKLPEPLLENLKGFGNNLARIMLSDYSYHSLTPVRNGAALLYRYDTTKAGLPKHAYLTVVTFPKYSRGVKLVTGVGAGTYKIGLTGVGIALVPADEPAVLKGNTFKLAFTKTKFMEAFNPWCGIDLPNCQMQLNLFFKDPATKEQKQRELAGLLLGALPNLEYVGREP